MVDLFAYLRKAEKLAETAFQAKKWRKRYVNLVSLVSRFLKVWLFVFDDADDDDDDDDYDDDYAPGIVGGSVSSWQTNGSIVGML